MTATNKPNFAFIGKHIISADIELKTGLHIGGTEEGFEIGGIDNPVIKDKVTGVPYIPGSSLKGKMRSLLEWAHFDGNNNVIRIGQNSKGEFMGELCNNPNHPIGIVFGVAAGNYNGNIPGPTRLTVRDALPSELQIMQWEAAMGEKIYTEVKSENFIDRLTSAANPRTMERVPARSVFKVQFVYDLYQPQDRDHLKLLFMGMRLLEDSYLGGGGTRGSGQVAFTNIKVEAKDRSAYVSGASPVLVAVQGENKTPAAVMANFDTIFPSLSGAL